MEPCEPSHAGHAHDNKGSRSYATVVPIAVRTRCIRGTSPCADIVSQSI